MATYTQHPPYKILLEETYKYSSEFDGKSKLQKVIQEELNTQLIESLSFEIYEKDQYEKKDIKLLKALWRTSMRKLVPNFNKRNHEWSQVITIN